MRKGMMSLVAAMLAVAVSGCSSSSNTYVCSFAASVGLCYVWTTPDSLNSSQQSALQTACTSGGAAAGTFSVGGTCPSTNRVGTCALPTQSGWTYSWAYYPPFNATTGQQECTASGGTWTAG